MPAGKRSSLASKWNQISRKQQTDSSDISWEILYITLRRGGERETERFEKLSQGQFNNDLLANVTITKYADHIALKCLPSLHFKKY